MVVLPSIGLITCCPLWQAAAMARVQELEAENSRLQSQASRRAQAVAQSRHFLNHYRSRSPAAPEGGSSTSNGSIGHTPAATVPAALDDAPKAELEVVQPEKSEAVTPQPAAPVRKGSTVQAARGRGAKGQRPGAAQDARRDARAERRAGNAVE